MECTELGPARGMVASEKPGSAGVAPELGPARVVPEPESGSRSSVPVPSEGRSSVDAGVPGVTPLLLKCHRTCEQSGSGSVDRPDEGSTAASKPEWVTCLTRHPSCDACAWRLEQVLHSRLDVPEDLVPAIGEEKAPKLVRVVNSVLISKNARFPESLKMCGSQVWLAKPSSVLSMDVRWMSVGY